jgi:recombinational DNA repair ATPase RecF
MPRSNGKVPAWLPRVASAIKDALLPELKEHTRILEQHTQLLEQHSQALNQMIAILHSHDERLRDHGERLVRIEGRLDSIDHLLREALRMQGRMAAA